MSDVMKVSAIAKMLGTTPQAINKWVRDGAPTASEKPRMIDPEALQKWVAANVLNKPRTRKTSKNTQPLPRLIHKGDIITWNRRKGRGWALAAPKDDKQPVDNLYTYIKQNGTAGYATQQKLRQQFDAGEVYFLDPVEALIFIYGQLKARQEHSSTEALENGTTLLTSALQELTAWREDMQRNQDDDNHETQIV